MAKTPTAAELGLRSDSFASGFDLDLRPRVICNIEGPQKSGKDHLAFTAPGPIVVFNFDCGLEGVAEQFMAKGKQIIVAGDPKTLDEAKYPSYRFARPVPERGESRKSEGYLNRVKKLAYPIWERFINDLTEFYRSEARTAIIDTGGAAYALARFAFHGMDKGRPDPKDDPYGQKSGDMKAIFQGLITDGYSYDKNVLWIHRIKEKWEGNSPSGKYEAAGYKEIAYECQITLRTKRLGKKDDSGKPIFEASVQDCRLNTEMEGEVFSSKEREFNFSYIMATVTNTEQKLWK